MTPEALAAPRWQGFVRGVSLLMAIPLSLVLLIHPASMLDAQGHYSHNLLMLVMWGVGGGYVHGVGFDPRALTWRLVFHPVLAWGLMAMGFWMWGMGMAGR